MNELLTVAQFAAALNMGQSTVRDQIRLNIIPASLVNPASTRPTYRIPSWVLRQRLGLEETEEPVYQSKLLAGRCQRKQTRVPQ